MERAYLRRSDAEILAVFQALGLESQAQRDEMLFKAQPMRYANEEPEPQYAIVFTTEAEQSNVKEVVRAQLEDARR